MDQDVATMSREELESKVGELRVAIIERSFARMALRTAVQRQIENIDRWMETGEPASPEDSRSIYEQLKKALDA